MKRRVEEAAKQEGSSSSVTSGLSGRPGGPPGGPAIVYSGPVRQHHNRGITPPGVLVGSVRLSHFSFIIICV